MLSVIKFREFQNFLMRTVYKI